MTRDELIAIASEPVNETRQEEARAALRRMPAPNYAKRDPMAAALELRDATPKGKFRAETRLLREMKKGRK